MGLDYIDYNEKDGLRIGAFASVRSVAESGIVKEKYTVLSRAAGSIASVQIRNRATIAGNICNAVPSADSAPALLTLNAELSCISGKGERIINIDTSRAERLPGVKGVLTGKDFGGWKWGWMPKTRDESPLAADKVRYLGEAVAAVAAIDEDIAEEAAGLIDVEYEVLPGVFDPEEAMKAGAPQVHDHVKNNLSWDFHMDFGDVGKAFRESDLVHEDRFETGRVITGYLEPPAAVAFWDSSGIWKVRPEEIVFRGGCGQGDRFCKMQQDGYSP